MDKVPRTEPSNLDQLALEDARLRPERIKRLEEVVEQLFIGEELAGLREEIRVSFGVPQFGSYHNEGSFMESHLDLILKQLEKIERGEFPEQIHPEDCETLQRVVIANKDILARYAFLHDIAKKDRLTIKYADKTTREISWKEWQGMASSSEQSDSVALRAFCLRNNISGISYFHDSLEDGLGNHGNAGKIALEKYSDIGVSPAILTAIAKHEVAYQFAKVSAAMYEEHFGQLSAEERELALVGSYVDTASSLRENGSPDLKNFLMLCDSRYNFDAVQWLRSQLAQNNGLDQKKVERFIDGLWRKDSRIDKSREILLQTLQKECRPDAFSEVKLRNSLTELMGKHLISEEELRDILESVMAGRRGELGKKYGKRMRDINEAIDKSKE